MLGQITPPLSAEIEIHTTTELIASVQSDELGRFRATLPAGGLIRLLIEDGPDLVSAGGDELDHDLTPGPGVVGGPPAGFERWRPSRNVSSPKRTTPTPISTQPQSGMPPVLDCSELVVGAGATWTVVVWLMIDVVVPGG